MKPLTPDQIQSVLSHLDSNKSLAQISEITGVSTGKISEIRSQLRSEAQKSVGGRPKLLSAADERQAIRMLTTGKADNAVQVTQALRDVTNTVVSAETVRRALRTAGMKAVTKKKRPLLKPRHIRERMDFAISHKDWTMADWKQVIWSDETKINRLGSDGKKWVWKMKGERLSSRLVEGTVKFGGGSLMLWGCMGWDGIGEAVWIQGKMDAALYTNILEDDL
jgi:transposase